MRMFWVKSLLSVLLLVSCGVIHAAIIELGSGQKIEAQIVGFEDNVMKFIGDRLIAEDLENIRSVRLDRQAPSDNRVAQEALVEQAQKVINIEHFAHQEIYQKVRDLLQAEQYAELEALERSFRDDRQRSPYGIHKLSLFYKGISDDLGPRDAAAHAARTEQVLKWKRHSPDAIAAQLAEIAIAEATAWSYRGTGYSKTITPQAREKLEQHIERASRSAFALIEQGVEHPMLYKMAISTGLLNGVPKQELYPLIDLAAEKSPFFTPAFLSMAMALLPRWGGEPGEVERFAMWASQQVTGSGNQQLNYFNTVFALRKLVTSRTHYRYDFDWERVKTGFEVYQERYLATDEHYHWMAKMAGLAGDRKGVKAYLSLASGQWNHFAKAVWENKAQRERFDAWADESVSKLIDDLLLAARANAYDDRTPFAEQIRKIAKQLNRRDLFGDTLLHLAVSNRRADIVLDLLASGVDTEVQNIKGETALHIAAQVGKPKIVELLLLQNANTQALTDDGDTPVYEAVVNRNLEVLHLLLLADVDAATLANQADYNPLRLAARNGDGEVTAMLLNFPELRRSLQNDRAEWNALSIAAFLGHQSVVRALVEAGADIHFAGSRGHTALSRARGKGHADIVAYLESLGAAEGEGVVDVASVRKALEIYKQGQPFHNRKDFRKAKALYSEALSLNPTFATAYAGLAAIAMTYENDPASADRFLDQAIRYEPNNNEHIYWKARANHMLGKPDVYRPLFQKYVELEPDSYNTQDLLKRPNLLYGQVAEEQVVSKPDDAWQRNLLLAGGLLLLVLLWLRHRQARSKH